MIANWALFFVLAMCAYIGISLFAQLSGGQSTSLVGAAIAIIKPIPLLVVILANMFFGMAIYIGFKNTPLAIPITIAIGVITSAIYSYLFLGAQITAMKFFALGVLILGIFLLV